MPQVKRLKELNVAGLATTPADMCWAILAAKHVKWLSAISASNPYY